MAHGISAEPVLMERLAYGLLLVSDGADEAAFASGRCLLRLLSLRVIRSGRVAHKDRLTLRGIRTGRRVRWALG